MTDVKTEEVVTVSAEETQNEKHKVQKRDVAEDFFQEKTRMKSFDW